MFYVFTGILRNNFKHYFEEKDILEKEEKGKRLISEWNIDH